MQYFKKDYIPEPTNVFNKIYLVLRELGVNHRFKSHEEIRLALGERFPNEPTPKQPAISKAMKQITQATFEFDEGNFTYIETQYDYRFYEGIYECLALFDERFDFIKHTVFEINKKTLVFRVSEKDAERFAAKIEASFPGKLFWGISVQNEYVYLMFDENTTEYDEYFGYFNNFFKDYMLYLLLVGDNISRSTARQMKRFRTAPVEIRTDTDDAR